MCAYTVNFDNIAQRENFRVPHAIKIVGVSRTLLYHSIEDLRREEQILLLDEARAMSQYLRMLLGEFEEGRKASVKGVRVDDEITGCRGTYKVLRLVDSGAMANIHEVVDIATGKHYAIKTLIEKQHDEVVVRRFVREARALATLYNQENIISLQDLGWHNNIPFIVMELLVGDSKVESKSNKFTDLIKRYHRDEIDLRTMLHYFADIAHSLDHLHSNTAILHRDIKPSNILLSQEKAKSGPDRFRIKLADFGLSAVPGGSLTTLTNFEQLIGTPEYADIPAMLNPDLSSDNSSFLRQRSDVYSLGIMLCLLITGKLPFSDNSEDSKGNFESPPIIQHFDADTPKLVMDTPRNSDSNRSKILLLIEKHRTEQPDFSGIKSEVPSALEALNKRMLAKNPDERPSASEVAIELQRIADSLLTPNVFGIAS